MEKLLLGLGLYHMSESCLKSPEVAMFFSANFA